MNPTKNYSTFDFPKILLSVYFIIWLLLAIKPSHRYDWFLENLLIFVFVPFLIFSYKKLRLSNTSYSLIFIFIIFHTIGTHYTYSEVPLGKIISERFGESRNHYDRFVHFIFGLLITYPIRELFLILSKIQGKIWTFYIPVLIMISFGEMYELIEWITSMIVAPDAGIAFLGSQGDVFDAQKDISLNLTGTLIATIITFLFEKNKE